MFGRGHPRAPATNQILTGLLEHEGTKTFLSMQRSSFDLKLAAPLPQCTSHTLVKFILTSKFSIKRRRKKPAVEGPERAVACRLVSSVQVQRQAWDSC